MTDEKIEPEEKLEERKKKETSPLQKIHPIAWVVLFGVVLIAYFFLNLSPFAWIMFIGVIAIVVYIMGMATPDSGVYLEETEAKAILGKKLEKKKGTGEIPMNTEIDIDLVSALPYIDGIQREYFMPFDLIDENNIPKTYIARMNRITGNTTYAKCPEGFLGTEKPTIRRILPEEFSVLKRMGLEKSVLGKLIFGKGL